VGAVLACTVAAATCACGRTSGEAIGRFEPAGAPACEIRVVLQQEHRRDGERYVRSAIASLETLTQWTGPYRHTTLTLVDAPWHGSAVVDRSSILLGRVPWWTSSVSMAPELATARAVAGRVWREAVSTEGLPPWFVAGLAEYSARRAVMPIFQGENQPPGFDWLEVRYFSGFVPRFIRFRLMPESDAEPLPGYRANPRADATSVAAADDVRSLEAKTVMTLDTLERWVGHPAFDALLSAFVDRSRGTRPTLGDFMRVASESTGQDLTWLLRTSLSGSAIFDYAVADLRSEPSPGGGFDTTVVVARVGDAVFSGTVAPRVGPFESGRGLTIAVAFDDGARVVDTWDGRDRLKMLRYHSVARALSAEVDPDGVVALDVSRTNNGMTLRPRAGAAATVWSIRWMLWFQHLILTWSSLV
jgi:hypothetical protein